MKYIMEEKNMFKEKKFNFQEDIGNMKKGVIYIFQNNDEYRINNSKCEETNLFMGYLL